MGPSCIKNHKDHILGVNVRNAWNHWNQKQEIMRYMKNPSSTNSQNIIYLQTSSQFFLLKKGTCVFFFVPSLFWAFCRFRLTAPVFMLKLPTTENRYFGPLSKPWIQAARFEWRKLLCAAWRGRSKPTWKVNNGHYEQGGHVGKYSLHGASGIITIY